MNYLCCWGTVGLHSNTLEGYTSARTPLDQHVDCRVILMQDEWKCYVSFKITY